MKTQLIKLTPEYDIKPFDCEDDDLNGFCWRQTVPFPMPVTIL